LRRSPRNTSCSISSRAADWFRRLGAASANPFSIFGYTFRGDKQYFYVVLAYLVVSYLLVTNLMRYTRRPALVAVRDHYLSRDHGHHLTKYRTLSVRACGVFRRQSPVRFTLTISWCSNEGFGIERSIIFLAMIIIGGTGSVMAP